MKTSLFYQTLGIFLTGALGGIIESLLGCAPFRDSPYSDQVLHPEREMNAAALKRLPAVEADGKIRIAVFTDSHQTYKDLDQVIRHINRTEDIDFVVNLGDVTNSGYNLEYDQFLGSFLFLKQPAFNIIGNHDALGAGAKIFKKIFGPLNFWFESSSHRYIFFNSANLEIPDEFDPQWLKSAVEDSSKPVLIFTHIPLRDTERFKDTEAQIMASVIEHAHTQLVLNGHNHVYGFANDHNTLSVQCARAEGRQWLLLEIQGTQISITRMDRGEVKWATLKN